MRTIISCWNLQPYTHMFITFLGKSTEWRNRKARERHVDFSETEGTWAAFLVDGQFQYIHNCTRENIWMSLWRYVAEFMLFSHVCRKMIQYRISSRPVLIELNSSCDSPHLVAFFSSLWRNSLNIIFYVWYYVVFHGDYFSLHINETLSKCCDCCIVY